jgi:aspartate oxidase
MMAALAASRLCQTVLITDRALGQSNSAMAQGGLQCPYLTMRSEASFCADMLKSARVELNRDLLTAFVSEVIPTVKELVELGLVLTCEESGEWRRMTAGGLSEDRIVGTADHIGPSLIAVLRAAITKQDMEIQERASVTVLKPVPGGWDIGLSNGGSVRACAVVVATGGQAYARAQQTGEWTTNPPNDNDSMYRLLQELGLPEIHQSFFQYQPFGLLQGARNGFGKAFPERVLALPIRILDRQGKSILAQGEKPDRLELCERMFAAERNGDAITAEEGRRGFHLLLDDVPAEVLEAEFPSTMSYLRKHEALGVPVLIRPFLHYHLGGFKMDACCRSGLPGLFLAGEITGGVHGRNRLMGNGLTDSLVHGRRAGRNAALFAKSVGLRKD